MEIMSYIVACVLFAGMWSAPVCLLFWLAWSLRQACKSFREEVRRQAEGRSFR